MRVQYGKAGQWSTLLTLIDVLHVDSCLKQRLVALILADDDDKGGLLRLKNRACTENEGSGGLQAWLR